jgi:hypothetical protein
MSRIFIVGGGALIAIVLAIALWYAGPDRGTDGVTTRVATVAPRAAGAVPGATLTPPVGTGGPAPWSNAPATAPPDAANQQKTQQLEAMQADLAASLKAGAVPDPRKVDAALAKIEEMNGKNVVSGVNLDAVRANLAIAAKLQVIAADLDAEAKKPGRPDTDRLRVLVAQVQQLQAQMHTDVSAPAQPAPASAAPK